MSSRNLALILAVVLTTAGCGLLSGQSQPSGSSSPSTTGTSAATSATSPSPSSPSSRSSASSTPTSATTPQTLAQAYQQVKGGVLRFEVASCDGSSVGTGFKISDSLAVTVDHVVTGASVVRVIDGSTATAGEVIGEDPGTDVALVRLVKPLSGPDLALAPRAPSVGDAVAAIGFPDGDPLTYLPGTINGLDRKAVIAGIDRHSMIELDAATTHGNSGGPVIESDGSVVGLIDSGPDGEPGRRLAVSSVLAEQLLKKWEANPNPVERPTCSTIVGPNGTEVEPENPSDALDEAVTTLEVYFKSINNGDFPTAVAQLYQPTSVSNFQRAVTSSQDTPTAAEQLPDSSDGSPNIWLQFTSHQDQGAGPKDDPEQTCTNWSLDYHFGRRNGLWLIRGTSPHSGSGHTGC